MAYLFYLDKVLLPIAPSKLQIKIKNQNKTLQLINESEVSILKKAGLSQIDFEVLLPNVKYPFAVYNNGFELASTYLEKIEKLKVSQAPFQFIVTRQMPNGTQLLSTNMTVSLEDYTIKEDAKQGLDIVVSIKLKQYKKYSTKICTISFGSDSENQINVEEENNSSNENITIGSTVIVNGRLHRDSYGNGAGQTRTNYKGKINFINKKGSHPYHVTTPEGAWLGWVTADSVKVI